MDLSQWNGILFEKLVKAVGKPRDPLYLYVDDELLAEISGIDDPGAALEDFKEAFHSGGFKQAYREAALWKARGFSGEPPLVASLAMSVLAVTLEPIGNANNVYRQQRQLLGMRELEGGKPADYECVAQSWKIWNQWLASVGSDFGAPTAYTKSGYTYQGWARSQAFLRFRDKQDTYAFFADNADVVGASPSGTALVQSLEQWLLRQGSKSRLAKLAADDAVAGELGVALEAMLKYWTGEREAAKKPLDFEAVLLWEQEDNRLDLVVSLSGVQGVVGTKVRDFDEQVVEFDFPEAYAYLSSPATDPSSWIDEPIADWQLAHAWTASWSPAPEATYVLERDASGAGWVSTAASSRSAALRVGDDDVRVLLSESKLQTVAAALSGVTDRERLGHAEGHANGYVWLSIDGRTEFPAASVAPLLAQEPDSKVGRTHRLVGGLKLVDGTYLCGFEPDVELQLDPSAEPSLKLDGQRLDWSENSLTKQVQERAVLSRSLTDEFLDPGLHTVEVRIGEQVNTSTFVSVPAQAPALPGPREVRRVSEDLVRFSLDRCSSPEVLVVTRECEVHSISFSSAEREWLKTMTKATGLWEHERFFDSSWLDWARPLPGEQAQKFLVAARADEKQPWAVIAGEGDAKRLLSSRRVAKAEPASPWQLYQLLSKNEDPGFVGDGARQLYWKLRNKTLGNLRDARGWERVQNGRTRPSRGVRKTGYRPATLVENNPLDHLLWWLTERGDAGVLLPTAEAAFAWLWKKAFGLEPPDFPHTVRTLESLGHVYRAGGKVFVRPPSVTWLPDSEALTVMSGARSEQTLQVLESGQGANISEQDEAPHAITPTLFTQTSPRPHGGSSSPVPTTPTVVLTQLGSRSRTAVKQAHELGFNFFNPSLDELRQTFPSLQDSLQGSGTGSGNVLTLGGGVQKVDVFIGDPSHLGGRWRALAGGLPRLEGDAFIRVQRHIGLQYAWWNHREQALVECGWVLGKWAFHQQTPTERLFGIRASSDQFAVAADLPLPPQLEHFLVMRSGLLPQLITERKRHPQEAEGGPWRLYVNIPRPVAALVCEKLGHRWSKKPGGHPTYLERVVNVEETR